MDLDDSKKFLLVKAIEEADAEGSVIPLDDRAVLDGEGDDADALLKRSQRLFLGVEESHPLQTQAALGATSHHAWIKIGLVAIAFVIGLVTKQFGPERRINVLAYPLLGVLAWNLLVYVAIVIGSLMKKPRGKGVVAEAVKKLGGAGLRKVAAGSDQPLAKGLSRFVARWHELTLSARTMRVRSCLHWCAAALSLGVVAGMYWNGLAYQYLAAWESTFLSAEGVSNLFNALFAPASAISGLAVPGLDEIRTMELKIGDEGAPAAIWIHLFAITVALFVVVPRAIFATLAQRKAGAVERAIDHREVAADYIARLLKTREGVNLVARLTPHRMELGSKDRDRLRSFIHKLWGGRLWVEFDDPIAYGDEDESEFESSDFQVLVLNFSATPEDESQGRLVERFRKQLDGTGLILLEAAPFRERFGGLGEFERRFGERRDAWEAVLGRAGAGFVIFDDDIGSTTRAADEVLLKSRTEVKK